MQTLTDFTGTISGYIAGKDAFQEFYGDYEPGMSVEAFSGTVWGDEWCRLEITADEAPVAQALPVHNDTAKEFDTFVFGDDETVVEISGIWAEGTRSSLTDAVNRALAESGAFNGDSCKLNDKRLLPVLKLIVDTVNSDNVDIERVAITDSFGNPINRPAIEALFAVR